MTIRGSITVAAGPMRSRKTLDLIVAAQMHDITGIPTFVYYPSGTERWNSKDAIVSRLKCGENHSVISYPAIALPRNLEGGTFMLPDKQCFVGFDDAQFFGQRIVSTAEWLRKCGNIVYIAGLDMDCFMQPFGPMPYLMAIADTVTKHTALCADCKEPAQTSYRLTSGTQQEQVGDEEYIPLCFDCYWYRSAKDASDIW